MKKISTLSTASVICVDFLKPQAEYGNKSRFFFGSLAAIYEMFTASDIGCNLNTLWAANITEGSPKITRNCIVSKHTVCRKKQNMK